MGVEGWFGVEGRLAGWVLRWAASASLTFLRQVIFALVMRPMTVGKDVLGADDEEDAHTKLEVVRLFAQISSHAQVAAICCTYGSI